MFFIIFQITISRTIRILDSFNMTKNSVYWLKATCTKIRESFFPLWMVFLFVLGIGSNKQVLYSIVVLNSIYMMNMFIRFQITSNVLFHNQTMLSYPTKTYSMGMIRLVNKYIFIFMSSSTFPPIPMLALFKKVFGFKLSSGRKKFSFLGFPITKDATKSRSLSNSIRINKIRFFTSFADQFQFPYHRTYFTLYSPYSQLFAWNQEQDITK